jgi:hypothetical protein
MSFYTNATENVVISSIGNIGIGTSTTYGRLQVGTTPSVPLLIVQDSGNVGIGTTTPAAKLEVSGGNLYINNGFSTLYKTTAGDIARFGAKTTSVPIYLHIGGDADRNYLGGNTYFDGTNLNLDYVDRTSGFMKFAPKGTGTIFTLGYVTAGSNPRTENTSLLMDISGNIGIGYTDTGYGTFGTAKLAVNGNVGIGTTNPQNRLNLKGPAATNEILLNLEKDNAWTNGEYLGLDLTGTGGVAPFGRITVTRVDAANSRLGFWTSADGGSSVTEKVVVDGSGNLGIGSTAPLARLALKGSGASTGLVFRLQDSNDVDRVAILDNGNIGLGTTDPKHRLELAGDIKLTGRIKQGALGDLAEMMPLAGCVLNPAKAVLEPAQALEKVRNEKSFALKDKVQYQQYLFSRPEPGDVVMVDQDGGIRRAYEPFATNVIGIISTNPAQVLRDNLDNAVPVTLSGIIPCKVSNENGAILPGDLLVSSSRPGHAMKAGKNPPPGVVIGKALGRLKDNDEVGVIEVIVMLR